MLLLEDGHTPDHLLDVISSNVKHRGGGRATYFTEISSCQLQGYIRSDCDYGRVILFDVHMKFLAIVKLNLEGVDVLFASHTSGDRDIAFRAGEVKFDAIARIDREANEDLLLASGTRDGISDNHDSQPT